VSILILLTTSIVFNGWPTDQSVHKACSTLFVGPHNTSAEYSSAITVLLLYIDFHV
jgi:hypothetical protein